MLAGLSLAAARAACYLGVVQTSAANAASSAVRFSVGDWVVFFPHDRPQRVAGVSESTKWLHLKNSAVVSADLCRRAFPDEIAKVSMEG